MTLGACVSHHKHNYETVYNVTMQQTRIFRDHISLARKNSLAFKRPSLPLYNLTESMILHAEGQISDRNISI
jgi:hypothetical protein